MPLCLGGHPHGGIYGAILLVFADTLNNLEEEAVFERLRIGVQELPVVVAIVEQVERSQLTDPRFAEVPLCSEVFVIVGGYRQGSGAACHNASHGLDNVGGGHRYVMYAGTGIRGEKLARAGLA